MYDIVYHVQTTHINIAKKKKNNNKYFEVVAIYQTDKNIP